TRRPRRTCADGGDTAREILLKIVCEEPCDECAVLGKILSKAAAPRAACGRNSAAEQGQRSQSASDAPRRAAGCGNRNPLSKGGNSRVRQLPCAAVAP